MRALDCEQVSARMWRCAGTQATLEWYDVSIRRMRRLGHPTVDTQLAAVTPSRLPVPQALSVVFSTRRLLHTCARQPTEARQRRGSLGPKGSKHRAVAINTGDIEALLEEEVALGCILGAFVGDAAGVPPPTAPLPLCAVSTLEAAPPCIGAKTRLQEQRFAEMVHLEWIDPWKGYC